MASLIKDYAREIKHGKELTGHMFLNRADALAASNKIRTDHKNANRNAEEDTFDATWKHFDVNNDGLIEVERMPQFFRMLLGNALDIDL